VQVEVVSGKSATYGELMNKAEFVAGQLLKQGCKRRDVIAIFAPNSIDWMVVCLAALRIGSVTAAVGSLLIESVFSVH